ncbi:MAG: leucine--tRNA ligase [Euryarchaeota archaeon]|nr:leucine--tRNA ligase [Euryarchaeota archaeon]
MARKAVKKGKKASAGPRSSTRKGRRRGPFEPDPRGGKPKFYITVAYPYPSGAMHVGHGRTYTVPDVIARFHRMRGENVLYPMGFHCTGTPVVGISERIARGDPKALWLYGDLYRVPRKTLEEFVKPETIVDYFSREYRRNMTDLLLGIDWRRTFKTIDPHYKRFIEWQYRNLMARERVYRGEHPVKWCPNDRNAVGDHDLLQGDRAQVTEYTLLKFRMEDGTVLPAATLRPETLFGCTNFWVRADATYRKVKVNGETWLVSGPGREKLENQQKQVEDLGEVPGGSLVGKMVKTPHTGKPVPILPAPLVDPKVGTGLVFSVPAHAPYDYMGLMDLKKAGDPAAAGMEPIPLIAVEGYGRVPAEEICRQLNVGSQTDPKLEEATETLYHDEFTRGTVNPGIPAYGGMKVAQAREKVKADLRARGEADILYDFSMFPVVCRCNTECIVKILPDQWFLKYSDPPWKQRVKEAMGAMRLVPPEVASQFLHTVDWLDDWACTRRVGLGTTFQWDPAQIVEPLSDSVIYMAYYTIAHHMRTIPLEKVGDSLFDYVLLGKGTPEKTGVGAPLARRMRGEFRYWYPYDWRFSAKDLVSNHLTFQVFHHTAIFPAKFWPRGIVVFGIGLLEGAKMSSSKGNVVLLDDALKQYGPDVVRLFLVSAAEPWQDFDWRQSAVEATREALRRFEKTVTGILHAKPAPARPGDLEAVDRWLLSRLQSRIRLAGDTLDSFQTRQAVQQAFYGMEADLRWYRRRTDTRRPGARFVLREAARAWILLMAPFTPRACARLWKRISAAPLETAPYPRADRRRVDPRAEAAEELIERTTQDIQEILRVTGKTPRSLVLYTAPEWKHRLLRLVSQKGPDIKAVMAEAQKTPGLRERLGEVAPAAKKMAALLHDLGEERVGRARGLREPEVLRGAALFLSREFHCPVEVHPADESPQDARARESLPLRPAVTIF